MDLDLPELHDEALASTRRYVAGIRADQWHQPTPCEGWTVRELLNHIVSGNYWAAELATGRTIEEVGDRLDGDVLDDDPLDAYVVSAGAASAAFRAPGAMEAPCAVSYGPVPGSVYAGHRFLDVLIHGWDLAVATGQPDELAPELVEACWAVVEPQLDLLVGSGMFGTDHDVEAGTDRQTQLLGVLGRQRPNSSQ
jgi:uncharacterized protein (TIGR03086 family)